MKTKELSNLSPQELREKVKELKTKLFSLRFELATGQLQNTMEITNVKRDIARLKTVLSQKEAK